MSEFVADASPVRAELSRKALHLASAALPISWSVGWISTPAVRLLLVVSCAIAFVVEYARRRSPRIQRGFEALFGIMLRPHERAALTGASWLLLGMLGSAMLFPQPAALVALWAVAVGDGIASVVGRLATRASGASTTKTWSGTIACLVATAAGAWWLAAATAISALLIGLAAAVAERPRLALDDNVRVAAAAGLAAWGLSAT